MYIGGYLIEIFSFEFYDLLYVFLSFCVYLHARKKKKKKKRRKNTKKIERLIISQYCTQSLYEIADRTAWRPNGDTIHGFLVTFFFFLSVWIIIWEDNIFVSLSLVEAFEIHAFHNFLPYTHTFFLSCIFSFSLFLAFTSTAYFLLLHGNDFFFLHPWSMTASHESEVLSIVNNKIVSNGRCVYASWE